MKQVTHCLPEWLLEKFRRPSLFELDIFTGIPVQRKLKKAGSGLNLWPSDIEAELSSHDGQAARIYRERLYDQNHIVLSDDERYRFAIWLAKFHIRVPTTRKDVEQLHKKELGKPNLGSELLEGSRDEILKLIRAGHPDLYDEAFAEFGADLERFLLDELARQTQSPSFRWPTADETYHHFMRNHSPERIARRFCEYRWVWLSSRHGFVIGDNPLVRWHPKTRRWNYGIDHPDVEITMPLGLGLCLLLDQCADPYDGHLIDCSQQGTTRYNWRQRLAAVQHVYGNSPDMLDF